MAVVPQPTAPIEAQDALARQYMVPKHGRGLLRKGEKGGPSPNPSGVGGRYHEVLRLAREAAPRIIQILIDIAQDPAEDSRARIVAAQEVLGRAFGRVPMEVKADSAPMPALDVSKLSDRELSILMKALGAPGQEKAAE